MAKIAVSSSPRTMELWLLPFAAMFTRPSWLNAVALASGALLCLNRRTVCAALRAMDGAADKGVSRFHRFLSCAQWSGLQGAKILLGLLQETFVPEGEPLVIAVDDAVERRRQDPRQGDLARCGALEPRLLRQNRGLAVAVVAGGGQARLRQAHLGLAVPDDPEPVRAGRCQAAAAAPDTAGEG